MAIRTGTGIKSAIAVGLPVGLIAVQLEVLCRIICNGLAHKMKTDNDQHNWKKMEREAWLGPLLFSLQTAIPTAIIVLAGPPAIKAILKFIPEWFTTGLTIASGMLPVVGIGMLMRYMPVKKFLPFIIIGFVCATFLNISVLGIALIGFAAGYWYFTSNQHKTKTAISTISNASGVSKEANEDEDDYDE